VEKRKFNCVGQRSAVIATRNEPVVFIEKSRDLVISWLCVGFFAHASMTNDQREVLFQSQKEDKAAELVDYAKTLYGARRARLKRRFPSAEPLREQAALRLEFANGSGLLVSRKVPTVRFLFREGSFSEIA
jgi:hypothetical protein